MGQFSSLEWSLDLFIDNLKVVSHHTAVSAYGWAKLRVNINGLAPEGHINLCMYWGQHWWLSSGYPLTSEG